MRSVQPGEGDEGLDHRYIELYMVSICVSLEFQACSPNHNAKHKKNPSIFVCLNWGEKRIRGEGKVYELNKFHEAQLAGEKVHKALNPIAFCHALLQYGEVWLNL